MNDEIVKTHSTYLRTLPMTLLQQLVFFVVIVLIDSRGVGVTLFMNAIVLYWIVFFIMRAKRPLSPTKADVFAITWGTFIVFTISVLLSPRFWRHYTQFM